eukprot:maker-scaffold62_size438377-snap-gene-1.5 protein:Tk07844 transcript:maker-scaffold62_size438377-snap-gene-1.5-mRNA-1 annotation:"predicted protein"
MAQMIGGLAPKDGCDPTVTNRVIYARKAGEEVASGQVLDGEPIDYESACKLKELAWGSSNMPPKPEWIKQGIVFRPCDQLFAYGMSTQKNGTKNFLMCLQAYFLKQLLFEMKKSGGMKRAQALGAMPMLDQDTSSSKTKSTAGQKQSTKTAANSMAQLLKPGEKVQQEILVGSLSELLMKIADGKEAFFCLPGPDNCFQATAHFGIDGITEKLYYYSDAEMKKGEYKETLLTIDTRNIGNEVVIDPTETEFEETPPQPLEKAIQT